MEVLEITSDDPAFDCNYSLGERLFLDLHRTLGDANFRQGFRDLYAASETQYKTEDYGSTSIGIGHIKEAFRLGGEATNTVIARWYDGTEPYDPSSGDTAPVHPSLPSINGRIDRAYIVTVLDGPPVSGFSVQDISDWVYLTLESSYSVSGGLREVALEIVEYYEDGFIFYRDIHALTAYPQYTGRTNWIPVRSVPGEWAPGRCSVYVYVGERKVAEVEYEVTP